MLTPIHSRRRQRRLLDLMERRGLDAVVIGAAPYVYYFTAHWTWWQHFSALVLLSDGRSVLITANSPNKGAAADDVRSYEAQSKATLREDQPFTVGRMALEILRERGAQAIGIDASTVTSQSAMAFEGSVEPIDAEIFQFRRVKDPDELELMTKAIDCCGAMYERAREIIEPGIPEVTVFAQLQAAAVERAGEPLSALLGNDYACGVSGGPPRTGRVAENGELYILDLGPVYRGYFSDNARTIAVNRQPTDEQYAAHEIVMGCMALVESNAKAGTRCRHLWDWVNEYLRQNGRPEMSNHLGHGVGLAPHEFPHLNPAWDDTLMEGEIIAVEPGLYSEELRGGIRIENQYRVTARGLDRLTDFDTGMA